MRYLWNLLYAPLRASVSRALLACVEALGRGAERLCERLERMQHYSYPQYLVACVVASLIYAVAKFAEWCVETWDFLREAFISKAEWKDTYDR